MVVFKMNYGRSCSTSMTTTVIKSMFTSTHSCVELSDEFLMNYISSLGCCNETVHKIELLKALRTPTAQWNYFLVPLTVKRQMDHETRQDWEDLISASADPSTFDELKTFF